MNLQESNSLRIFVAHSLIGFGFGIGVARTLFELDPLIFEHLGNVLPILALGLLGAVLLVGFSLSTQKSSRWSSEVTSAHRVLGHLPLLLPLLTVFSSSVAPLRGLALLCGGLLIWLISQFAMVFNQPRRSSFWIRVGPPVVLFVISLGLYLRTLAPTVGEADTFEFQVNVIRLAISHGSGYPLYILLAKLFSWLPVAGTEAYRINMSAAVFGALAVVLAYMIARTLHVSAASSAIASLSLGVSFSVWSRAVEAEVYTLNLLFVGLILWLLLTTDRLELTTRYIPPLFLSIGLSCANHLTTILLIPSVTVGLFIAKSRVPRRTWVISLGLFLLGLAVYLYLPIRWPVVNNGEVMTIERFLYFFTAENARVGLRPLAFVQDFGRYGIVGRKVLDQYGWIGIGLGLLGLASLARRHLPSAVVTSLAYAAYSYFGLSHYSPDPDFSSFLLPAHLVHTVWMAVGLDALIRLVSMTAKWKPAALTKAWPPVFYTLFALMPISAIWQNYDRVNQSQDWDAYYLGRTIMEQTLSPGAAILADSEKMPPLYYLQVAENLRPDLDIVVLYDESSYRADLETRIAKGQKVYLGRYLPHLAPSYSLESVGPLVEVNPNLKPSRFSEVKAEFGNRIRLADFNLESDTVAAGDQLSITVTWQTLAVPHDNHLVTFRLQDAAGKVAQAWPGRVPVSQMYPTNAWPLGRMIADYHSLRLEHELTPGEYWLQVGLFPLFSNVGLPVSATGIPWATITPITILPATSSAEIGQPTRIRLGEGLWLLGYNLPTSIAPGAPFDLILHWMTLEKPSQPLSVEITESGATFVTLTIPVNAYPPRHPFSTRHRLMAPRRDGNLSLEIGRTDEFSSCRWLARPTARCSLPAVQLDGLSIAEGAVNFDNRIVLESLEIMTPEARQGEMVTAIARWRSLSSMTEDYTIFVHLLGPDGRVHGQVDIWPAQGTLATSQWQPGQVVRDRFEIGFQADAATGEYQIEIGWYLLTTLERLPVLSSDGTPIADKYLQPGLVLR